ncbi:MAG: nitrous oxide reductase family maturation protein NosD, partial [Rhodocyclaceae bacterium]
MLRRLSLLLLFTLSPLIQAAPSLQALIDATPPGGVLHLPPGEYAGPVRIAKPLTLDGGGKAVIRGNGQGTVVSLVGHGITLRGLAIAGSGESLDGVDAGVLVEGRDHVVADNRIEDVLFGIHLRQAVHTVVSGNQVVGKPLALSMRGDAIRMWQGAHNRIEHNRFQRARDLTFINSQDSVIANNRFTDGRYGMQIVFSPRLQVEHN